MLKYLIVLPLIFFCVKAEGKYTDHRGHNVDSLETVYGTLGNLYSAMDSVDDVFTLDFPTY